MWVFTMQSYFLTVLAVLSKFQDMFILDTDLTNVEDRRVSPGTIYRKIDIQIVALGVHIDVQHLLKEIIFGDARHK